MKFDKKSNTWRNNGETQKFPRPYIDLIPWNNKTLLAHHWRQSTDSAKNFLTMNTAACDHTWQVLNVVSSRHNLRKIFETSELAIICAHNWLTFTANFSESKRLDNGSKTLRTNGFVNSTFSVFNDDRRSLWITDFFFLIESLRASLCVSDFTHLQTRVLRESIKESVFSPFENRTLI